MARRRRTEVDVPIPPLPIETCQLYLVGDSPLICHAWNAKAEQQILGKQMKKARHAKQAKNPWEDFCNSLYWLTGCPPQYILTECPESPTEEDIEKGAFGFPSIAFKAAAVEACPQVDGVAKTKARAAMHIVGEYVKIEGKPKPRRDFVRLPTGVADIRFRAEFWPWHTCLTIRFNANVLSLDQIVNLFQVAGFGIGVGEGRPERGGQWGLFHVATEEEIAALQQERKST